MFSYSNFCDGCEERFNESHFQRVGPKCTDGRFHIMHEYKISLKELQSNVDKGCGVCKYIGRDGYYLDSTGSRVAHRYIGSVRKAAVKWSIKCCLPQEPDVQLPDVRMFIITYHDSESEDPDKIRNSTQFFVHASSDDPAAKFVLARDIEDNFGSQKCFQTARNWLKECTERHENCDRPTVQPLPTRVLEMSSGNDGSKVSVLDTNGLVDHYVALSYAWGPEPQPKATTLQTLEANHEQIFVADLPKTIQDAIFVTRQMGLKYLWVDSMCIIQDSEQDKRAEISKMRLTYKNAYFTIIGARAKSSSEGFLDLRPRAPPNFCIRYGAATGSGEPGTITLRNTEYFEDIDRPRDFTESRAWCLEESVLSPRCLVYSNIRLRWNCREKRCADGDYSYKEDSDYKVEPLPRLFRRGQQKRDDDDEEDWVEVWKFWMSTVKNYTTRELTRPDDRLRAISGLANEIQALYGDVYFVGLWERKLLPGLLWFVEPGTNWTTMTKLIYPRPPYIAPSWSWASVRGIVGYCKDIQAASHFRIIDHHIEIPRSEPFGNGYNGSLTVSGRLKLALWDPDEGSVFDCHDWEMFGSKLPATYSATPRTQLRRIAAGFPDTNEFIDVGDDFVQLYCLEVSSMEMRMSRPGTPMKEVTGLLLLEEHDGRFRRLGLFQGHEEKWFAGVEPRELILL